LRSWSDVEEHMTSHIVDALSPTLELEARGNWVAVFRCRVCGQRWAEEYPFGELHGGGPRCFYAIAAEDPRAWLTSGPGLPGRLREDAEDRAFFDALGEERSEARCAAPDCPRGAISHSVFCRVHHFEMVRRKPCPFET
jgi:hypothetical protein